MNSILKKAMTVILAGTLLLGAAACTADEGISGAVTSKNTQTSAGTSAPITNLTGKIVASGSTSMEELMTALGEAFNVINPGVTVEIQGGGSSTGIKNVTAGVSEIGNSSRALKTEEKTLGLTEHVIAIDGIALAINPANAVTNLTKDQLIRIFTGVVTNWKDVGGADAPIVVILRETGSGTRDGFETLLGIVGKSIGSQEVNETGIVKSTVAGNVNAIGYLSLGKVDISIKAVSVDGVVPSEATVKDGSYTLQRPFVCLTKGSGSDLVKAFFSFVFSAEGQTMVAQKGYVPIGT
jgi:phosphate transport system substrate-binding protein